MAVCQLKFLPEHDQFECCYQAALSGGGRWKQETPAGRPALRDPWRKPMGAVTSGRFVTESRTKVNLGQCWLFNIRFPSDS